VVEESDCVLLLGELISDTSLGVSAHLLNERNLILCVARDVFIGHHRYQNAPLEMVVSRLLDRFSSQSVPGDRLVAPAPPTPVRLGEDRDTAPIRMVDVIDVMNEFVEQHPDMPLVADTGDALFAAVDIRANDCLAPAYYATMGFAVPAALGAQISSGRRPLVLVGDGAFQMTGPEISHAPAYGCTPIVVLLNNGRWEMLQSFFPDAGYNETAPWPFAQLVELWGGRGFQAATARGLREALSEAWREECPTLVEVRLARGDISPVLRGFVEAARDHVRGR
jgi:indolepyruvate decarboxylase